MKNIYRFKSTIDFHPERLILISGNGQNTGKTKYACQLIKHLKNTGHKVYALKVSPKIHVEQPPHTIFSNENFVLSLEKEIGTGKDSSRYLDAGADASFFLQVEDKHLEEAAQYAFSFFPKETIIIAESGGMRNYVKPQLFFFLKNIDHKKIKEKAQNWPDLADRIVQFDGTEFDFSVDKIKFENGQIKPID